jgi:hypothetical protein
MSGIPALAGSALTSLTAALGNEQKQSPVGAGTGNLLDDLDLLSLGSSKPVVTSPFPPTSTEIQREEGKRYLLVVKMRF